MNTGEKSLRKSNQERKVVGAQVHLLYEQNKMVKIKLLEGMSCFVCRRILMCVHQWFQW